MEDYNWTADGPLVQKVYNQVIIPFGNKHEMEVHQKSIESGMLRSLDLWKNDLIIGISMSRISPMTCRYYDRLHRCESDFLSSLWKDVLPNGKGTRWLYEQNGLPQPEESDDKEERWTLWMSNYVYLLEKYCSELLETGDICGWLAKHQDRR